MEYKHTDDLSSQRGKRIESQGKYGSPNASAAQEK
jgi:hypothetical protein